MGRISRTQPTTEFGRWLLARIDRRGLERKAVAMRAGVGKTTVSQLISGARAPSRDMVLRLASALLPDGADEETRRDLTNQGLRAAGFTAEGVSELLTLSTGDALIIQSSHPVSDRVKESIRDYAEYLLERKDREAQAA